MSKMQEPVTIGIRARAGQQDLMDQAADRLGRSRSNFMLGAARRQTENVLPDQTYSALDAKGFEAFREMPDNPPAPIDPLRRTLKAQVRWKTTDTTSGRKGAHGGK